MRLTPQCKLSNNADGEAVNRFKPLSKHAKWIEEIRGVVGLSVAVAGDGSPGVVNGRETLIVEELTPSITNTVDLVSYAGRGGRFLESYLAEANALTEERTHPDPLAGSRKENETMAISEERFDALVESVEALVAKLTEASAPVEKTEDDAKAERKAVREAVSAVESADISDATKSVLLEGIEDGNYDVESVIEREKSLREEIRAELEQTILTEAGASARGTAAATDTDVKGW